MTKKSRDTATLSSAQWCRPIFFLIHKKCITNYLLCAAKPQTAENFSSEGSPADPDSFRWPEAEFCNQPWSQIKAGAPQHFPGGVQYSIKYNKCWKVLQIPITLKSSKLKWRHLPCSLLIYFRKCRQMQAS